MPNPLPYNDDHLHKDTDIVNRYSEIYKNFEHSIFVISNSNPICLCCFRFGKIKSLINDRKDHDYGQVYTGIYS